MPEGTVEVSILRNGGLLIIRLDGSQGIVTDVLSTANVHHPGVTDRESFRSHHAGNIVKNGHVSFNFGSEYCIDILF